MRPRSFDRGNPHSEFVGSAIWAQLASMRPRSFDRGNSALFNYSIFKDLAGVFASGVDAQSSEGVIRPLGSGAPC